MRYHLSSKIPGAEDDFLVATLQDEVADVNTDSGDVVSFQIFVFDAAMSHTLGPVLRDTNMLSACRVLQPTPF